MTWAVVTVLGFRIRSTGACTAHPDLERATGFKPDKEGTLESGGHLVRNGYVDEVVTALLLPGKPLEVEYNGMLSDRRPHAVQSWNQEYRRRGRPIWVPMLWSWISEQNEIAGSCIVLGTRIFETLVDGYC